MRIPLKPHSPGWRYAAVAGVTLLAACGKDPKVVAPGGPGGGGDGGSSQLDGGGLGGSDSGLPPTGCVNLQCQQAECTGGGTTSISGIVYDPAGNNPLYNVVVYVPNAPLEPLDEGTSCNACASLFSGSPVVVTQTDARGRFTLEDVPAGANIPLVVQVGKWRRQLIIDNVAACQDNPQPDKSVRLPRNSTEGDLPNIAISTGGADTLECLLRRVGVDASEYTPGAGGTGRVHIFRGGDDDAPDTSPGAPRSHSALWNEPENLLPYDILLLSCEGEETNRMNQQALHDYASAGGRVFASHFHYAWFNTGPYGDENLATWYTGSNAIDDLNGDIVTTLANGQSFPKGQALADWLENVGALQNGKLPIEEARYNADVTAANTPSQAWILADEDSEEPGAAQYFSFNTPTDAISGPDLVPAYCGRVVFSDLHVGAASGDDENEPVPDGCADRELSAQEAALEFMLFDLSACVTPDDRPPLPPPVLQ